jgi:endonuclease/exonuclease/phosphatase family metal-dependent hydrolase
MSLALVLPLVGLHGARSLPTPPDGGPVRYMSYNLHQSFGTGGEMDVEAIAAVIEDSGATVVGLQEVARAGLLNANTDLVHLLGDRLGWEHVVFHGTTDPVWGNAILSRYPLGEAERQVEELLDAGWVDAWAEAGSGDGYTSNAADPRHRIDYVFHTPDLTTVSVEVIESQASDHLAVVADITGE